jgi:ATP-binding cassette subfamily F protein uup
MSLGVSKVTDHLFVFEGDGVVRDYPGSLSEYAECLVEQEDADLGRTERKADDGIGSDDKKISYKEEKAKRNERRNALRRMKKDMVNLENAMENLKPKATALQEEIDSSTDEGWSVLAELTAELEEVNAELDENEVLWLELAEEVERLEAEAEDE